MIFSESDKRSKRKFELNHWNPKESTIVSTHLQKSWAFVCSQNLSRLHTQNQLKMESTIQNNCLTKWFYNQTCAQTKFCTHCVKIILVWIYS